MPPTPLTAQLVTDPAELTPYKETWDALAVTLSRPCLQPGFLLPWWQHARLGETALRAVIVREGERLIGIAPTFAQISSLGLSEYRFMGAGAAHRLGPLAEPGRESEVAALVAETIRTADPRPSSLVLEGFNATSEWPDLLAEAWSGRVQLRRDSLMPAPVASLDSTFEDWFKGRSSNFRQQLRRRGRRLEGAGASWRVSANAAEARADLQAMFRIHYASWERRGGSRALSPPTEQMLLASADELVPKGRMRLWTMEVDGAAIASQLFFAAGDDVAYWGGGVDPAWDGDAPGLQLLLREIEDACGRGAKRLDFGGGAQPYKWRFADVDEPLAWRTIFPIGARWPLTRAQLAPKQARHAARGAARRLPDPVTERLRALVRR